MQLLKRKIRKARNAYRRMKAFVVVFYGAVNYGLFQGVRYLREPRYRRQVRTSVRNRHRYGAFLGNKVSLRDAIIKKRGRCCELCCKRLRYSEMTLDHIVPVSRGGTNKVKNLRILCEPCHVMKTKIDRGDPLFSGDIKWENRPFKDFFDNHVA